MNHLFPRIEGFGEHSFWKVATSFPLSCEWQQMVKPTARISCCRTAGTKQGDSGFLPANGLETRGKNLTIHHLLELKGPSRWSYFIPLAYNFSLSFILSFFLQILGYDKKTVLQIKIVYSWWERNWNWLNSHIFICGKGGICIIGKEWLNIQSSGSNLGGRVTRELEANGQKCRVGGTSVATMEIALTSL